MFRINFRPQRTTYTYTGHDYEARKKSRVDPQVVADIYMNNKSVCSEALGD